MGADRLRGGGAPGAELVVSALFRGLRTIGEGTALAARDRAWQPRDCVVGLVW